MQLRSSLWKAVALCSAAVALLPGNVSTAQLSYFKNGCKVGPEYSRPAAPVAPGWIDEGNPRLRIWAQREQLWWIAFNDPTLNSLIQAAYAQSLTLRAAGMRVLVARAQRDFAAGELFPQFQQGFGGYERVAESLEVANRGINRNRFFDNWVLGGQLLWELDFWGQFRRNLSAADARLDARIEDYDDVLVILVADVATAYIDYRTFEQRLAYAQQNLAIQEESARLAKLKVDAGVRESDLDLVQAKSDIADIQSLIPDLELGRRRAMNRLSVLLGMPPANLAPLLGERSIPAPPPELALGVPADLLRQRPDIRSAERDLAAQCEQIGIAIAQLYPHISINGAIFVDSEKFSNLFTPSSWGGAAGPNFRWDILNYGRLAANTRQQQARFNELIYDYQQRVLVANEEVENSIAAYLYSHQRVKALEDGTAVSLEAVQIGSTRYKDGVSDFNRLSNLQVVLAQQQDALASSQGQVARSWVDVYRSLGGGWQIRLPNARPYMPGIEEIAPPGDDLPPPDAPPPGRNLTVENSPPGAEASPGTFDGPQLIESKKPSIGELVRSKFSAAGAFLFHRNPSITSATTPHPTKALATVPPATLKYPDAVQPHTNQMAPAEICVALPIQEFDPELTKIELVSQVNVWGEQYTTGPGMALTDGVDIYSAFDSTPREVSSARALSIESNPRAISIEREGPTRIVIDQAVPADADDELRASSIALLDSVITRPIPIRVYSTHGEWPATPFEPVLAPWKMPASGEESVAHQPAPQPPLHERFANLPPSNDLTPIIEDPELFSASPADSVSTISFHPETIQSSRATAMERIKLP